MEINLAAFRVESAENLFLVDINKLAHHRPGHHLHLSEPEQGGPVEKGGGRSRFNRPGSRLMGLAKHQLCSPVLFLGHPPCHWT